MRRPCGICAHRAAALRRRHGHMRDHQEYVIELERWYHGTNRPWYMGRDVGTMTPSMSKAWRGTREGAEKLVGSEVNGRIVPYTPRSRA